MYTPFTIKKGLKLELREGRGRGKPNPVTVADNDNDWMVRLFDSEGKTHVLPKVQVIKFYQPVSQGNQLNLFGKAKSVIDDWRSKYLKV